MRRTPEIDAWLKSRLQAAVDTFCGGSADAFGRMIGYTNGGSVRQSLGPARRVQQAILDRSEDVEELRGWFVVPAHLLPHTTDPIPDINQPDHVLSEELTQALKAACPKEILKFENMARAMLGMPPIANREGSLTPASGYPQKSALVIKPKFGCRNASTGERASFRDAEVMRIY